MQRAERVVTPHIKLDRNLILCTEELDTADVAKVSIVVTADGGKLQNKRGRKSEEDWGKRERKREREKEREIESGGVEV